MSIFQQCPVRFLRVSFIAPTSRHSRMFLAGIQEERELMDTRQKHSGITKAVKAKT